MGYPHKTISLNGKRVSIQNISKEEVVARSAFEQATFDFIKNWVSGKREFELRTSGSTGIPKKLIVTRKQMVSSARLTIRALNLKKGANLLLCIDPNYIGGMMMMVRAFENNMRIFAVEPTALKGFTHLPSRLHFAAFVPLQIQNLIRTKGWKKNFDAIKTIIIGGAPLDPGDAFILRKCKTNSYVTYGMTETLSHVALKKISPEPADCYMALDTIRLSTDSRGCLIIHAPFLKKSIATNDLVELIDAHSFRWLGRADHIINSGGIKVIPEQTEVEIGRILKRIKIIRRFYIKGVPDSRLGERVVLILEGEKLKPQEQTTVLNLMKAELPRYHAPKEIRYESRFKLVNSKLKRA